MRKVLHSTTLLLLAWCLSLAGMQQARASHAQAGQLTYEHLGNNQYRITVAFFRDCSGIPAPTSFTLQTRNTCGGSAGPGTTLNPIGTPTIGSPYCAAAQAMAPCPVASSAPSGSLANYLTQLYQGTVTLPPASEWIIYVEESSRPSVTNLVGQGTLHLEATLNSRITLVGGGTRDIVNNSPVFSNINLPVPFVCWKQESTITFSAVDNDTFNGGRGDSLSYSLDRPLSGCGSYETYSAYPGAPCRSTILSQNPLCLLDCGAGGSSTYSSTLPILVNNDTVGTCPLKTVQPRFIFNAQAGSFRFTPSRYLNNTTSNVNGDNKYAVVGKVTEWRKINGRYYKVGSVRRDFLVIVIDCGNNLVPSSPTGQVGPPVSGGTVNITRDTTDVNIFTCNYTRVRFNFTDPNNLPPAAPSTNLLTVYPPANINTLLQGGDIGTFVISNNGTATPSGTFYFQPSNAFAATTLLIPLRIEDNACPAKGVQYKTIRIIIKPRPNAVRVVTNATSGLPGGPPQPAPPTPPTFFVCAGGQVTLTSDVQRPDSVRNVATNQTVAQRYTFRWTGSNGTNGLPVPTPNNLRPDTLKNITVNPTVTTRYRVRIEPVAGFGGSASGCGDTSSVLVRVVPPPVAAATASLIKVCPGAAVTLRGTVSRPNDPLTDTYTYQWTGTGVPAGATSQNIVVRPTATTTYTFKATGTFACEATTTIRVEVVPQPTISARNYNPTGVCAGTGVSLKVGASRSDNAFNDTYTYQWTAAPGLNTADATKDSLVVTPTVTTRYYVRVSGDPQYNCTDTTSFLVRVLAKPTVQATTSTQYVCPGGSATLTATATRTDNVADTYTYTWRQARGTTVLPSGASISVSPTATTRYILTATGQSQYGCSDTTSVVVRLAPSAIADFTVVDSVGTNGQRTSRPPVFFKYNNASRLSATAPGLTLSNYTWTSQRVRDITGATVTEPAVVFSNNQTPTQAESKLEQAGFYKVTLTTFLTIGTTNCTAASVSRIVTVPDIDVPNIITPNGDKLNDVFKISSASTLSKLEIYNRWGRKVKEYTTYNNDWAGEGQPDGIYYYLITDRNGAQTKGWLEIIRGQ